MENFEENKVSITIGELKKNEFAYKKYLQMLEGYSIIINAVNNLEANNLMPYAININSVLEDSENNLNEIPFEIVHGVIDEYLTNCSSSCSTILNAYCDLESKILEENVDNIEAKESLWTEIQNSVFKIID